MSKRNLAWLIAVIGAGVLVGVVAGWVGGLIAAAVVLLLSEIVERERRRRRRAARNREAAAADAPGRSAPGT